MLVFDVNFRWIDAHYDQVRSSAERSKYLWRIGRKFKNATRKTCACLLFSWCFSFVFKYFLVLVDMKISTRSSRPDWRIRITTSIFYSSNPTDVTFLLFTSNRFFVIVFFLIESQFEKFPRTSSRFVMKTENGRKSNSILLSLFSERIEFSSENCHKQLLDIFLWLISRFQIHHA